jgi:excisionase family DNA binding protein
MAETTAPILLRPAAVAALIGCSRSKTYQMLAAGDLPGVIKLGGSVRVHVPTLLAWLAEQAATQSGR